MASPFPGMDPYLEDPALWPNVHSTLINVTRRLLSRAVGPRYFVGIEERLYVSSEDDPGRDVIVPDLYVKPVAIGSARPKLAGGSAAVAEPIEVTLLDPEIHEYRVEIIDREDHAVITVIEYLSPANKVANSDGRRAYLDKRRGIYESNTHWIEIDLLRTGTTLFNRWAGTSSDYGVHLSRRLDAKRRQSLLWLIRLQQQLPEIRIPLKAGDADAMLDLQEALRLAYEEGEYERIIDYASEPRPPLADDGWRWARELLVSQKRRA